MKPFNSFPLRAACATTLLLGLHGLASAAITTEHATVCKAAGDQPYAGLYFDPGGVTNQSGGLLEVVCPVFRTQSAPSGAFAVWLDGFVPAGASMTCTMYSSSFFGDLNGSVSINVPGPSRFDRSLALPSDQVDDDSSEFVTCAMPANAQLYDIEPVFSVF